MESIKISIRLSFASLTTHVDTGNTIAATITVVRSPKLSKKDLSTLDVLPQGWTGHKQ
ncbi:MULTISPECIES: hypothetical protein [unclassified Corynebacterium]|uniref:hypothetical protein n=1 Tax=unclassified Corynebacterium TaxID=2624378 RepID=UPI00163DCDBB|nr:MULTISPECIES: hypothetical protein [unclassified Corynebacterium]